jgi:hypothetical protein
MGAGFVVKAAQLIRDKLTMTMKITLLGTLSIGLLLSPLTAPGQNYLFNISPLSTFGGGDGWLSPGEGGYTYLTTGSTERGLGYGNGHLYLVSRNGGNFIRILNPTTGADLGALNTTGVSGGTFAVNLVAAGGDGAIYVGNLTTADSSSSPFTVYKWANEGATPTVAYTSGGTLLAGGRIGDTLAAIGSGSSTRLAAGFGSSPVVAGNNGYAIVNPTAGTATVPAFAGTTPAAGDFRLGLTFSDASHVLGSPGSSLYRYTVFSGANGTLISSPTFPDPAGATADRLLAFTVFDGHALLAVQSTGDSHVSVYDATDPSNPIYLGAGNNTSGTLTANVNGTGDLAWGAVTVNGNGTVSETLYAMSSNQGIQAFIVTIPEPGALGLTMLGLSAVVCWRKTRR